MTDPRDILIGIDFETASKLDLKIVGAAKYASDPSTHVLCLGYSGKGQDALIWRPGQPFPPELVKAVEAGHTFVAHNAQFDRQIWKHQLTAKLGIPLPTSWLCTAVRASANGLPRGMDDCCKALGIRGKGGDGPDGPAALKIMMQPDKKTGLFVDTPALRADMERYCRGDLDRLWQMHAATLPISEWEQQYYDLDQAINERGFAVDRVQVDRIIERLDEAQEDLSRRIQLVTRTEVRSLTSVKDLLAWLAANGLPLENLQAQTIQDVLDRKAPGSMDIPLAKRTHEVLRLRQLAAMSAPKKFKAFRQHGQEEGDLLIMRDTYVMHGAHTGRHSSRGLQSQNLKRDTASELEVDILLNDPLDHIQLLIGEPLEVAGRAVRPMIRARPGKKLLIGDFSKIETCVLFALAGAKNGLKTITDGGDLYRQMASAIYGIRQDAITSEQRQLGKAAILGLGFGCGAGKFFEMCAKGFGQPVSVELADKAVETYRREYRAVRDYWYALEGAVKRAIRGTPNSLGLIKLATDEHQLVIQLPSGRKIRYQSPKISGDDTVQYNGVSSTTRQWSVQHSWGGKFTENVVQAIANDLQRLAALDLGAELFDIVLHSHDELVAEDDESRAKRFKTIMELSENPAKWVVEMGIPIKVDLTVTERYRKK